MIKPIKKNLLLTMIITALALYGELSAMSHFHTWLAFTPGSDLDLVWNTILIVIFVCPLIYFIIMIEQTLFGTVTDHLTHIHNRVFFNAKHQELISKGKPFQLMLLDLCKFKEVNDTHGHVIGDEVLKAVADRLKVTVGNKGHVARLGGDEFVILLPGNDAEAIAKDVSGAIKEPILLTGITIETSASIGVASYPGAGSDTKTLMTKVDCAMYNAKRNGLDIFVCHPGDGCCDLESGMMQTSRNRS